MSHKFVRIVALALAVCLVAPALVLAATEMVSGTISAVDMDKRTIMISMDENQTRELKLTKKQLKGLEPGQEVTVEIVDGKVKAIRQTDEDA